MPPEVLEYAPAVASLLVTGLGIPLIMEGPDYFWWGVPTFYAGVAALFVSVAINPRFKAYPLANRLLCGSAGIVLLAWFSRAFIFLSAPLDVWFFAPPTSNYQAGTQIGNIIWQPDYVELRLHFANRTDYDFEKFDIRFKTNLSIITASQITVVPNCTIGIDHPMPDISIPVQDVNGKPFDITVGPGVNAVMTYAPVYRLRCDELPEHTDMEFIAALFDMRAPKRPKTPPSWVIVEAKYKAARRARKLTIGKCLYGECLDMPVDLSIDE